MAQIEVTAMREKRARVKERNYASITKSITNSCIPIRATRRDKKKSDLISWSAFWVSLKCDTPTDDLTLFICIILNATNKKKCICMQYRNVECIEIDLVSFSILHSDYVRIVDCYIIRYVRSATTKTIGIGALPSAK